MKILLITFTLLIISACSSTSSKSPADLPMEKHGVENVIGSITKEHLFKHFRAFQENYTNHTLAQKELTHLQTLKSPIHLVIVFGTWCHDSEREVPRLLKLIEAANNPNISYELISVGYDKTLPKNHPRQFSIEFTPTVLVLDRQGNEINRVIEKPEVNWAMDITQLKEQILL